MKYIGENLVSSKNAGSKARTDVETILHGKYSCLFNINAMPTSENLIKNILLKVQYFSKIENLKNIHELKNILMILLFSNIHFTIIKYITV